MIRKTIVTLTILAAATGSVLAQPLPRGDDRGRDGARAPFRGEERARRPELVERPAPPARAEGEGREGPPRRAARGGEREGRMWAEGPGAERFRGDEGAARRRGPERRPEMQRFDGSQRLRGGDEGMRGGRGFGGQGREFRGQRRDDRGPACECQKQGRMQRGGARAESFGPMMLRDRFGDRFAAGPRGPMMRGRMLMRHPEMSRFMMQRRGFGGQMEGRGFRGWERMAPPLRFQGSPRGEFAPRGDHGRGEGMWERRGPEGERGMQGPMPPRRPRNDF